MSFGNAASDCAGDCVAFISLGAIGDDGFTEILRARQRRERAIFRFSDLGANAAANFGLTPVIGESSAITRLIVVMGLDGLAIGCAAPLDFFEYVGSHM